MAFIKADQFELPGTEPAFNLAGETIAPDPEPEPEPEQGDQLDFAL